ncbi:hypothetical protein H4Q26_017835 [Puccinia striiformis f. sp. tritici PST-130]|nr:hypothetical protein H4Q26_017835 [Puccinia striiformis f. sp. tritici PST-130]
MSKPNNTNTTNHPIYLHRLILDLSKPRVLSSLREVFELRISLRSIDQGCGTPNDKELIELEQETAAPWVPGRKRLNQLEEDEILQEVLEEEAAIARLTEAAKNQEPVAGQASKSDSLLA